jgi:hypothetical protein
VGLKDPLSSTISYKKTVVGSRIMALGDLLENIKYVLFSIENVLKFA